MKKLRIFHAVNFCVNILLLSSLLLAVYGLAWEYSTRAYLKGFSDAVIPSSASPERKVAALLSWMENGPVRQTEDPSDDVEDRDPEDTLNYQELLRVCGTATNAFVNLASSAGIETRRLLLLDSTGGSTNHVVAEVHLEGRWVIVDPSFHAILRDRYGRLLTREQLSQPAILRDATSDLPDYDLAYNYENTTHVHLARIPYIGRFLPRILSFLFPKWEESVNWTVLTERESFAALALGMALLFLGLFSRRVLEWYGQTRLSVDPIGPWEQLRRCSIATLDPASIAKSAGESTTLLACQDRPPVER